jgi:DNA repair protein RadD
MAEPAFELRSARTIEALRAQGVVANALRERREIRGILARTTRRDLTSSHKDILEHLVHLWFAHRYGEGVIRPGRERIAKRCRVSVSTVKAALALFRKMGIISVASLGKGGAGATRYTLDLQVIRRLWGGRLPQVVAGELVLVTSGKTDNHATSDPVKNCPRIGEKPLSVEPASSGECPDQQSATILPFPSARSRTVRDLLSSTAAAKKDLRPHQVRAISLLRSSLGKGNRRVVVQGPTGFGKTLVAAKIIEGALAKGNTCIFAAPAISLIDQTVEAFKAEGIQHIGVLQGNHPGEDKTAPIQVASVQTLARRDIPSAALVIVDECHIRAEVIDKLMVERPDVFFVGLSATPWRKGMGLLWQDLVIPCDIADLIESGFLSEFRAYAPDVPDLRGVKTVAGDYAEAALAEVMGDLKLVGSVVETWLAKGENRPTLCFAVNRAHADQLRHEFLRHGVGAEYVDANTDRIERAHINRLFRDGDVRVICSVRTMTTGVDLPVSCIIDAAPTKSEMLHVQKIGRGLRVNPGTEDCLILDHAGNSLRLGLVTDIRHEALDATKPGEKAQESKPKAERLPNPCPECTTLFAGPKCPCCGHERKPPRIEAADGNLVELRPSKRKADHVPLATKTARYAGLLWIAAERGYKPGWAYHKYVEWHGVQPASKPEPAPPTNEVHNWLRSRQIAYAKARAKADGRAA